MNLFLKEFPEAIAKAKESLAKLMIEHPCEMEIEDIAWQLGAYVRQADIKACEGRMLGQGGRGVLSIKKSLKTAEDKRWVIAHELGHFLLHSEENPLQACTINEGAQEARPLEAEAQTFATELLMPESLLRPVCDQIKPDLADIDGRVAKPFKVRLSRAALRYVQLTEHPCAYVWCEGGKIAWSLSSKTFPYQLSKGTPLSENTKVRRFFDSHGQDLPPFEVSVPASVWLKDKDIPKQSEVQEHSRTFRGATFAYCLISLGKGFGTPLKGAK